MSDQPKPQLLVMSKEALKELDGAQMRKPTLAKYDTHLPGEMTGFTKNKQLPPAAGRIMVEMGKGRRRELSDTEVQQLELVARMLSGEFGEGARAVGTPQWLVDEVQNYLGNDEHNPTSKSTLNLIFDENGLGVPRGGEEMLMVDAGVKMAKLDSQQEGRMAKLGKKLFGGVEDSWKAERDGAKKSVAKSKSKSKDKSSVELP